MMEPESKPKPEPGSAPAAQVDLELEPADHDAVAVAVAELSDSETLMSIDSDPMLDQDSHFWSAATSRLETETEIGLESGLDGDQNSDPGSNSNSDLDSDSEPEEEEDSSSGNPKNARGSGKSDVEVAELWREFKDQPTTRLRNRLVERYLPLVKYNAERIWQRLPEGVDLDDLISAGVFGLMDAIDAFDLTRGVKFETYCVPRIRGAMLDELRTMDWVPRLVRSKHSKMEEARKALEAIHGRPPTDAEIAERMGVSLEDYEKMSVDANAVGLISLNKKWYETDSYKDVREIDILEDKKGEDPTSRLQRKDLMRMVTKGLNRNERLIIILYYYEELTMKEIGVTLDLSESRVSQMHSSIIQRLQQQLSTRRPEFGG